MNSHKIQEWSNWMSPLLPKMCLPHLDKCHPHSYSSLAPKPGSHCCLFFLPHCFRLPVLQAGPIAFPPNTQNQLLLTPSLAARSGAALPAAADFHFYSRPRRCIDTLILFRHSSFSPFFFLFQSLTGLMNAARSSFVNGFQCDSNSFPTPRASTAWNSKYFLKICLLGNWFSFYFENLTKWTQWRWSDKY